MDINYNDKGVSFVNKAGATINFDWYEFWELCRHGRMIDTVSEVTEYIRECDEIAGLDTYEVLHDDALIKEIADEVINKRIGYESGDDIWEVANRIIKRWRKSK